MGREKELYRTVPPVPILRIAILDSDTYCTDSSYRYSGLGMERREDRTAPKQKKERVGYSLWIAGGEFRMPRSPSWSFIHDTG